MRQRNLSHESMNIEDLREQHGLIPIMAEAIDQLDDPSNFPGLKALDSDDVVLQLFRLPSFHPMISWTIFRTPKAGSCVLRRVRWDYATDCKTPLIGRASIYGADTSLSAERLSQWLSPLDSMPFPAFKAPEAMVILDGTGFGLRRKRYYQSSELWWSSPPTGWEELVRWSDAITNQLDEALPEASP